LKLLEYDRTHWGAVHVIVEFFLKDKSLARGGLIDPR
jgi:hypothetical protein